MTLTDQKGNIRGREFPTDTGIDGNACEETTKDQRWVGLCRQIPDTDTRPTSVFLSLSLSLYLSFLSFSLSRSSSLALPLFLFFSLHTLSLRTNSPHLASLHPSIRPYDPLTIHASHTILTATTRRRLLEQAISTMGIRSGIVPCGNDRGDGQRATTSFTHGPLSYDSRYFEKHQAHPYQVNNIYRHRTNRVGVRSGG